MEFVTYSNASQPTVMLTPGLGVSYEIFRGMNHGELLIGAPHSNCQTHRRDATSWLRLAAPR